MKYILLCGGSGKRLQISTSFPKPLNHVQGIQSIQYVLESIPSDEIYVIVNKDLQEYNFDTLLHHLCKKTIHYTYLDRYTRGPVETAYLGLLQLNFSSDEQVCFFDNDTIYMIDKYNFPSGSFIGYSSLSPTDEKGAYCYLQIQNSVITNISEKVPISNTYACGIYGFQSSELFLSVAKKLIVSNTTYNNEYYMSLLYNILLQSNQQIQPLEVKQSICLGTFKDISTQITHIPSHTLRVCFDIDNTLFKYRTIGQSYKDCEPISKTLFLLRKLKELGHTIILYTARGMKTASGNQGVSMKNVAKDTFDVLDSYAVPYDEIYFGKPDADLYIDDKAFNPYINLFESIGFNNLTTEYLKTKTIQNNTNKFNTIYRNGDTIVKTGPSDSMKGECYFYESVKGHNIEQYFPKFKGLLHTNESTTVHLEYIHGFTLFELLKDGLLTKTHIKLIIDSLHTIHNYNGIPVTIQKENIYNNYMGKLFKRIKNIHDYPFENTVEIINKINVGVQDYLAQDSLQIASVVHGDPWFSNTLFTTDNTLKFLDMKGDINGVLTTNGDALTDFGKILQSLLGFDYIVNGISDYDQSYLQSLRDYFLEELKEFVDLSYLYNITACLIAKTLSFLDVELPVREKVWQLVVLLINNMLKDT